MPCVAKKYEAQRPELSVNGLADVDAVITTRELARMIKMIGIDFNAIGDGDFDNPLGVSTGAGLIFGTTGGVMEAALRTVADILNGSSSDAIDYVQVRGLGGRYQDRRGRDRDLSDSCSGGTWAWQCAQAHRACQGGRAF